MTENTPPTTEERDNARLIADVAHHDIWWYRSNQWNASNWSLLLIAGIVGVARMFLAENELAFRTTWHLALLEGAVAILSSVYVGYLHKEIIETRRLMRKANNLSGVEQLRTQIWDRSYEKTDHSRGALLVAAMDAGIAIALGVAVAYLTKVYWLGWAAGVVTFFVGCAYLAYVGCFRRTNVDA